MSLENSDLVLRIAKISIHPMLAAFSAVCFLGVLLTDLTYWQTAQMMWADFSVWLITTGVILGVLAAIAGLIDLLRNRAMRAQPTAWLHMFGTLLVLVLSLFNGFIHSRDAWTSVVPTGLTLSAVVVVLLLMTSGMGWFVVYRTGVAK
jgi:uncharacterized membrane protein